MDVFAWSMHALLDARHPNEQHDHGPLVFTQFYLKHAVIGNGSTCSLPSLHIIVVDCVGDARPPRLAGMRGGIVGQMLRRGKPGTKRVSS